MIAGLLGRKLADRGQYTKGVTGQHDDVGRLTIHHAGNMGVGDVLDRVRATSVFSDTDILVIRGTIGGVVDDVFEDASESDGIVDIRFLFRGEVDAFSVAATLNVEDASIRPYMFIVANQETIGVGREGGLSGTR